MALSKTQQQSREPANCPTLNHNVSSLPSDPTSFPRPVSFMQRLSAEYSSNKSAMEAAKQSYKEQKEAIKHAEWQAKSKSNELDESIKRLRTECESVKQFQAQKLKEIDNQKVILKESCDDITRKRRTDVIFLNVLRSIFKDFPNKPSSDT